jgi:IS1 family transposase
MNQLSAEQRTRIIAALVDGNSIRATCRIVGVAKGTVLKLLPEIGEACQKHHDAHVRGITSKRVQCDEIWSFCYGKERNISPEKQGLLGFGDVWTFTAIDAETKLMVSYYVGLRNAAYALTFMRDLVSRLANRVQLTTDGHNMYVGAVESAFGWNGVDFSILVKRYAKPETKEARYSPPKCIGATKVWVTGDPDPKHVSTSYVERSNLTMRMNMRRFTRLTNAFSKKLENHKHAVALFMFHYNWCRPHTTLTKANGGIHKTPAMAAGLTDHVWTLAEVVALLPDQAEAAA